MATEADALVRAVAGARSKLFDAVSGLDDRQGAYKPGPDQWSIAEILEHLYLAELTGVTKIWTALNDVHAGNAWPGELPHRGKPIEEIIAATWQPRETAPPVATPSFGGPLAAWVSAFRGLQPLLQDLAVALDGTPLETVVFPHFLSGPLDARQRLEFLRYHIERHLEQVHRVRGDAAFPG